jgi:hypothetical protein
MGLHRQTFAMRDAEDVKTIIQITSLDLRFAARRKE